MLSFVQDISFFNSLSANPTKCSNTNCLSVFDQFWGLALEGLKKLIQNTNFW